MRKTICDVCGKEITGFSHYYKIKISSDTIPDKYHYFANDVCKDCVNSIYHYIKRLEKEC